MEHPLHSCLEWEPVAQNPTPFQNGLETLLMEVGFQGESLLEESVGLVGGVFQQAPPS